MPERAKIPEKQVTPRFKAGDAKKKPGKALVKVKGGLPALPGAHKLLDEISKLQAIIDYAKRAKDWETVDEAVEAQLDCFAAFVKMWDEHVTPLGKGGDKKSQNRSPRPATLIPAEKVTEETGITKQTVSRWRRHLADEQKRKDWRDILRGAAYKKAFEGAPHANHRAFGTGEDEWYTPKEWIARASNVMGGIDLDPASCEGAQSTVKAAMWYGIADDGLKRPWEGKVWLNPPYAQPAIAHFADKLVEEFQAENVTAAVALTHNYTDTKWFRKLASASSMIAFTYGRVKFVNAGGKEAMPTQGQAFFLLSEDEETQRRFIDQFAEVATVVRVVHT